MKRRRPSKSRTSKSRRARRSRSSTKPRARHTRKRTNNRQQATRGRAFRVLRRMRKGASLSAASRAERTKPATVRRHVGSAVRRYTPGGRFRAAPTDRLVRSLQVRTADGELVRVPARTLAAARLLSRYENAVGHFLRTGDASRLRAFQGKSVTREDGRRATLMTDPERWRTLAAAGLAQLDSLYVAPMSEP